MYTKLISFSLFGLDAIMVDIEVTVQPGIAKFEIIGLADASIRESRERIFHSIKVFGYEVPPGNITINLAPAEIKKKGTNYDLAIALGILISSGQINSHFNLTEKLLMIAGELALDGRIRSVNGLFNTAMSLQNVDYHYLIPNRNLKELQVLLPVEKVQGVSCLKQAVEFIQKGKILAENKIINHKDNQHVFDAKEGSDKNLLAAASVSASSNSTTNDSEAHIQKLNGFSHTSTYSEITERATEKLDFNEVFGNEMAKLALQISAIAKLNVLFIGPPGCGKSMLLKRLPTILPDLERQEALNVTRIHLARDVSFREIIYQPPFREVFCATPVTSLIGGGTMPKPGEISLAHNGYLFLDELSEFQYNALQSLRIPIEAKKIKIDRVLSSIEYPCNFTLVAATNPCRCGYFGDLDNICTCSKKMISRFYSKLSGPLIDRFDIIIYIQKMQQKDFYSALPMSSEEMKNNVIRGRKIYKNAAYPYTTMNFKKLLDNYPLFRPIIEQAIEKELISIRRLRSILKTCAALQAIENKSEVDEKIILNAVELCRYQWMC